VVSPSDVLLGPLPGLPILAAVPSAPLSGLAPALLGAPLLAGIAAGVLLGRRPGADRRWSRRIATAGLSALVAGVVVQLAVWASAGALGSGRLAAIGPHGLTTGLYAVAVTGVGLLLGTLLAAAMPARRA